MLDAFIIDKIRRERESRDTHRVPMQIEVPRPQGRAPDQQEQQDPREDDERERGVVIIDFSI